MLQDRGNKQSNIWIKEADVCLLLGCKKDTLRKKLAKKIYNYRCTRELNKRFYEVDFHSLPQWAQQKYLNTLDTSAGDPLLGYMEAPRYKKEYCDKYFHVIQLTNNLRGNALIEFLQCWNAGNNYPKMSYRNLLRLRQKYLHSGFDGLLPKYGRNTGKTTVKDEYFEYFKNQYLNQNKPTAATSHLYTLGYAMQIDGIKKDDFPSVNAFLRRLKKEVPEQMVVYAREGEAAWNRSHANYIERDYSHLTSNECWVSDHAQIDVMVIGKDGKPCCPWVTAWRDMKSNKWLGWLLHEESGNSDHIFQSFYYAAKDYGLPEDIILDNGKDFRCKDFAGGRQNDQLSMVQKLGINVHFALPYNAQTKPIERDFLKIKETLSRHCVGFRGGDVLERPEKLKDEIKQHKLMSFDEFKNIFDKFIVNILNKKTSNSKKLRGMSPDQLFASEYTAKKTVTSKALAMFCMRTSKPVTIKRNGIKDSELQINYWAEWMVARKGDKVYLRRDVNNYAQAYVFDALTDSLIGEAAMTDLCPVLVKDGISKEKLKKASKLKAKEKSLVKQGFKPNHISLQEAYLHLETAVEATSPKVEMPTNVVNKLNKTKFDDEIQQYEERKKTGTYDLKQFYEGKQQEKLYLFESDKKYAEMEAELLRSAL